MAFKIFFHPKAVKEFRRLDKPIRERVKKETGKLKENSQKGKHLHYSNFYSLRIGDYRVIYEIKKTRQTIIVLYIGHRKHVYEDFSKLF